jgi:hypothetical protein
MPSEVEMQEYERIRAFFWHKSAILTAEMNDLLRSENEVVDAFRARWQVPGADSIEFFLANARIKEHERCFCGQSCGHVIGEVVR